MLNVKCQMLKKALKTKLFRKLFTKKQKTQIKKKNITNIKKKYNEKI